MRACVSIIVVTYNSAKTVLDTLDSIYKQTWKEIELIVTDDCSTDNTKEVVDSWIREHNERFVNAVFVEGKENRGIPANINKGLAITTGEYIQLIAGDDLFISDGIEKRMRYAISNPGCIIHTRCKFFGMNESIIKEEEIKYNSFFDKMISKPIRKQYRESLHNQFIMPINIGPIHKSVYHKIGFFDERYRLDEDWLMILKLYSYGYRILSFSDVTAMYRCSDTSLSHGRSHEYMDCQKKLYHEIRKPYMIKNLMFYRCLLQEVDFLIKDNLYYYGRVDVRYRFSVILLCLISPKTAIRKVFDRLI